MPEKPDCTILIPVPRAAPARKPSGIDCITFRLHMQCLSAKSPFLRGLLDGIRPLDLIQDLAVASRFRPPAIPFRIPRSRLPRFLAPPPSHPVLFLPVPDPSSIQTLFHWMYCGNTDHIENALDQGLVQWEGLARNVEYLCLSTDIKVFLGRWYRNWLLPPQYSPCSTPSLTDDDDSLDLESDSGDSECNVHSSSSRTDDDDRDRDRGRTRDVKQLEQPCGSLRLSTT